MFVSAACNVEQQLPPSSGISLFLPRENWSNNAVKHAAAIMSQQQANYLLLDLLQENHLSEPRAAPECPPELHCQPAGALKQLQSKWKGRITFRMTRGQRDSWKPRTETSNVSYTREMFHFWLKIQTAVSQLINAPFNGTETLGGLRYEAGFGAEHQV